MRLLLILLMTFIPRGEIVTQELELYNSGDLPLVITNIYLTDGSFVEVIGECDTIYPYTYEIIKVSMESRIPDTLIIISNDTENSPTKLIIKNRKVKIPFKMRSK